MNGCQKIIGISVLCVVLGGVCIVVLGRLVTVWYFETQCASIFVYVGAAIEDGEYDRKHRIVIRGRARAFVIHDGKLFLKQKTHCPRLYFIPYTIYEHWSEVQIKEFRRKHPELEQYWIDPTLENGEVLWFESGGTGEGKKQKEVRSMRRQKYSNAIAQQWLGDRSVSKLCQQQQGFVLDPPVERMGY